MKKNKIKEVVYINPNYPGPLAFDCPNAVKMAQGQVKIINKKHMKKFKKLLEQR